MVGGIDHFPRSEPQQLHYLRCVTIFFQAISRLKINIKKCDIIPVREGENQISLASNQENQVINFLQLTWDFRWRQITNKRLDGIQLLRRGEWRLARWKKTYLSEGGRLVFNRNTLLRLCSYLLSLVQLPASLRGRLDKLIRDFLCDGNDKQGSIIL